MHRPDETEYLIAKLRAAHDALPTAGTALLRSLRACLAAV
jgi:hypothetical protein